MAIDIPSMDGRIISKDDPEYNPLSNYVSKLFNQLAIPENYFSICNSDGIEMGKVYSPRHMKADETEERFNKEIERRLKQLRGY